MLVDVLFVVVIIGILIAIYKIKFGHKKSTEEIKAEVLRETTRAQSNQLTVKNKQQNEIKTQWAGDQEDEQSNCSDSQNDIAKDVALNTRLALYKEQKKKQKQQRKQAHQHFLSQQKQKKQEYQKLQQQKQREEQQKRKKEEQYIEMMREQQRKRKQQEFNKWKDMFSIEEEGVNKESEDVLRKKQQQLENNLISYLKSRKLVLLQDISHKFYLTTKDLVEKIKKFQSQSKITGVFDERGKFLYIEKKQWDAIRNYITAKGRLKKIEMMNECAKIIKIPQQNDQDLINLVNETDQLVS